MKTTVLINGQISGNFTLLRVMHNYEEKRNGMFSSFYLEYKRKKDAQKDIAQAYHSLISDEPDAKGRLGGIRKSKSNTELYYDASQAIILNK